MDRISERMKTDSGWNDPPMLNYSTSNPPPKSRINNKRVAYPLFTKKEEKIEVVTAPVCTHPVAISNAAENEENSAHQNSIEILTKSLNNFNKVLDESGLEQKQFISKMLQNMRNMWEQHNITETAQKQIFDMSRYLVEKDVSNAEMCYFALAAENGTQYGSWLIGIRHLFNRV